MEQKEVEIFGNGHQASRGWLSAMVRGMRKRCPKCGKGKLFQSYSRVFDECNNCNLNLKGHRADDAPPYVTIIVVGHVLIPVILAFRQLIDPPISLQFAIWLPLLLLATIWFLPISKGGLIGLQWANRMHGFATPGEKDPSDYNF